MITEEEIKVIDTVYNKISDEFDRVAPIIREIYEQHGQKIITPRIVFIQGTLLCWWSEYVGSDDEIDCYLNVNMLRYTNDEFKRKYEELYVELHNNSEESSENMKNELDKDSQINILKDIIKVLTGKDTFNEALGVSIEAVRKVKSEAAQEQMLYDAYELLETSAKKLYEDD